MTQIPTVVVVGPDATIISTTGRTDIENLGVGAFVKWAGGNAAPQQTEEPDPNVVMAASALFQGSMIGALSLMVGAAVLLSQE
jgi:hypothetical protein